jgi:hypothetical protein
MFKCFETRLSRRLDLLLLACVFFVALGYAPNASAVVRVSAGVTDQSGDYDLLSRYGQWTTVQPYGDVWCPDVDANWEPFSDGRWIRTSDGWAWDSYEPFGELVYHYGYWYNDADIGWFWVPGNEWSPARVQWYTDASYCGWAPLPPPNVYWPDPWDSYGSNVWVVVNINDFCDDHIGRYGIDRSRYRDMFQRTGFVRRGPDFRDVEIATRRQIPVQRITERPMGIRGSGMERGAVVERQNGRSQRQTYQPQQQPYASRRNVQPQQQPYASRRNVQPQQQPYASRRDIQPQQQPYASRRNVQPQQQPYASRRNVQPQQQPYASRRNVQPQQQPYASRRNMQPQQQPYASRRDMQPQRQRYESRQNTRGERRAEAPARGARSAQWRTAEKRSHRAAGTKEEQ